LVSGIAPAEARRRATTALEQVGLADRLHHRPAELSGGQRQRVTIARALVNEPAIVWADEPTGNLDSKSAHDIVELMRSLNTTHNQTFVIVTHDAWIGAQCDRLVRMQDGQIIGDEAVMSESAGDTVTAAATLPVREA
jgi:putative ABC transport system ATP-binding protein